MLIHGQFQSDAWSRPVRAGCLQLHLPSIPQSAKRDGYCHGHMGQEHLLYSRRFGYEFG